MSYETIWMHKGALALLLALATTCATPSLAADQGLVGPYPPPTSGGAPWTSAQVEHLKNDVEGILRRPILRGAHIGFLAVLSDTGSVLFQRAADEEFIPASNFKLLVGSAALARLGPQFTFKTTVATDGENLYLRGGGDVRLSAKDLDAAAATIAGSGLQHLSGNLVTDASYFDSQHYGYGWSWDDFPYYYAPVISALGLEDNVIHIYMRPGNAAGEPVLLRVEPRTSAVPIDNRLVTGPAGSKDTSDLARSFADFQTITLTGSYPLHEKESDDLAAAVPDPAAYAGDVLRRALAAHGVTIDGAVAPGVTPLAAQTLWTHDSEPMPQLLEDFWWSSDNLLGEVFLKTLGVQKSGAPGTDEHGIAVENAFLQSIGVDPSTVSITDGSGLSHYDHITPRDLTAILQSDWNTAQRVLVLNALPLAGVRGTLKSSFVGTPAERNVFAKTGSISHVRTISGFLRTRNHGTVTFSFMLDDYMDDAPGAATKLAALRADLFSRIITSP